MLEKADNVGKEALILLENNVQSSQTLANISKQNVS